MSGFEVFGVIGTAITIIDATIKVYDAIKDLHGLPDAFREVNRRLPLLKNILTDAGGEEAKDDTNPMSSHEATSLKEIIDSCNKKVERLCAIFTRIQKSSDRTFSSAYRSLTLKLGKASRVETLMSDIWKDIDLLMAHRVFKDSTQKHVKEVEQAKQELERVTPSLPDSDFQDTPSPAQQNAGRDINNNNNTGSGTQRNIVGASYEGQSINNGMAPPNES
ncbi:hypothetical protein F4777DRAFT_234081 [Nemania sp. FL0916]|nr:hypothetical protein F4777DRAFT_234081 [Nemania sp. FL0916]